jgi:membrane protease YdiL (CAAX protease family)
VLAVLNQRTFHFLKLATWFEGSMILLAYGLGWMVSIDPFAQISLSLLPFALGLLGTIPLYLLFAFLYSFPLQDMQTIKQFLMEKLGPFLSSCRWTELLYLGLLAGISEEILFRGFLQAWFEREWGWLGGIVFSNLIFALVHWITPLYGLLAGLTGVYLGLALDFTNDRNLLIPITIHVIYDFLAFLAVAQSYRHQSRID